MANSIKKLKNSIITISVVLGTVIAVLAAMLIVFVAKSNNYKLQLENGYKKNLYEFVSNINSLEVDLSKLVATNSTNSQRELLRKTRFSVLYSVLVRLLRSRLLFRALSEWDLPLHLFLPAQIPQSHF